MRFDIPATPANIERPAVVAVASGKGGVGKTHLSVNLSVALGRMNKRVLLLDADLGLANAGLMLGVRQQAGLDAVIERRGSVADAVHRAHGIGLVAGGSGVTELATLGDEARERLCAAFAPLVTDLDYLVVDTPSGIGPDATQLAAEADVAVILLSDEPAAFMDAYATLKVLHLERGCGRFLVVTNMVADEAAGRMLFDSFARVACRFLSVDIRHLGSIPRDRLVRDAAHAKRPLVDLHPTSRAAQAFTSLARALDAHVARHPVSGANAFFRNGDVHARAA